MARAETARLSGLRPRRVINATGVLLHTNLGRAQIPPEAAAISEISAAGASPLEFDLSTGSRGGRGAYAHALLTAITGAEAALVVNNTAGALLLSLAALAGERSVVVSRGELIEIGGSFRLPELMAASGAHLAEVGTTNRTRLKDYRKALDSSVGAILKVHPSNYRIEGFTDAASFAELGALAHDHDRDKLLGGPQAGIAVGSAEVIDALRAHPVARAVRIAGPMLDALGTTLELYADGRGSDIPFWAMASLTEEQLDTRCRSVVDSAEVSATVITDRSLPGAGTVPGMGIRSPVILVAGDVEPMWRSLLDGPIPIVGRRDERGLIVDLRAVLPSDDAAVATALSAACR
jgi:L-seryl-tRNA(Ser) seleniumtransferase